MPPAKLVPVVPCIDEPEPPAPLFAIAALPELLVEAEEVHCAPPQNAELPPFPETQITAPLINDDNPEAPAYV